MSMLLKKTSVEGMQAKNGEEVHMFSYRLPRHLGALIYVSRT